MGACNFKARLQILGVIREDVGTGKDWKQAATDSLKRAAVRFGIGHELYEYEQNWVQMDGDGKFARPVEDPGVAYARRYGRPRAASDGGEESARPTTRSQAGGTAQPAAAPSPQATSTEPRAASNGSSDESDPLCPKCEGRMWDNRLTKRNPKAPDFKCRDRSCDGVIWPPKGDKAEKGAATAADESEIPF
jgi:hypothetical protein